MECRLAGETEVLGENLPRRQIPRAHPGLNPGHRGGKPATNRLSYGAAPLTKLVSKLIPIIHSKTPAQLFSSSHKKGHILKFYLSAFNGFTLSQMYR
jgi:hypothetical protein